jgi:ADP-heptose:LPS heptosyltransferase
MKSKTFNHADLSIAREIVPFLKLRFRMLLGIGKSRSQGEKSTLIVVPCILGDSLSYLPAIRTYVERHQCSFDLVVSPDFLSLAEHIKGVRHIYLASSSYARASENKQSQNSEMPDRYDTMVVLRLSPEGYDLVRPIQCTHYVSSDFTLMCYLGQIVKSSLMKEPVRQSREVMFEALNLPPCDMNATCPEMFDIQNEKCSEHFERGKGGDNTQNILIHTGSGWSVKLWDDEHWIALLSRIHQSGSYHFTFIGRGEDELQTYQRIQSRLPFDVSSVINKLTLWELYLQMRISDFFIGIDSGPRNLAHYANLRSVTLLNPAAVNNFMPLDCRDQTVEKPNRFPANVVNTQQGATLDQISVNEVWGAFERLTSECRNTITQRS